MRLWRPPVKLVKVEGSETWDVKENPEDSDLDMCWEKENLY